MSCDCRSNASWLAYGTPSKSQITPDATGSANPVTRSAGAVIDETTSSIREVIIGSSSRIRRTVNWPVNSLRYREWSGGSMNRNAPGGASGCLPRIGDRATSTRVLNRGSVNTCRAAA
jgi:hypothetical protein